MYPWARPLFCIHGLGGHVAAFLPLAQKLAGGRPVYGLQAQGLDPGQEPHDRIEAMAASYVKEIRDVQPQGPYLLSGWSMGGLIALEAARQLLAAGQEVALVAMLDTYLSLQDFQEQDFDEQSVLHAHRRPTARADHSELTDLPLQQQWERIAELAKNASGIGIAEIRRLAAACKAHLRRCRVMNPALTAGRCVLFPAQSGRRPGIAAGRHSVRNCASSRRRAITSASCQPHVQVLAERMDRYLQACDETQVGRALARLPQATRKRDTGGRPDHETAPGSFTGVLENRVLGRPDRGRQRCRQRGAGGLDPAYASGPQRVVGGHDGACSWPSASSLWSRGSARRWVLCRMDAGEHRRSADQALPADPRIAAETPGGDRHRPHAWLPHRRREPGFAGDQRRARAGVNLVILVCGAVYLGWLSLGLMAGCLVFAVLGMASYWYSSRLASKYVDRSRQAQNVLHKRVQGLIEGVKELKMHHDRRREYVGRGDSSARHGPREPVYRRLLARCGDRLGPIDFLHRHRSAAVRLAEDAAVDSATLTAYTLTIFYLMSPLEQIIGWLPFLAWAMNSVAQIEHLGLALDEQAEEAETSAADHGHTMPAPVADWQEIELAGATHAYRREGQPNGFVLGPDRRDDPPRPDRVHHRRQRQRQDHAWPS